MEYASELMLSVFKRLFSSCAVVVGTDRTLEPVAYWYFVLSVQRAGGQLV